MFPFLPLSLSLSAKKVSAAVASANLSAEADTFAIVSDGVEEDEYYVPKDDYSGKWSIYFVCVCFQDSTQLLCGSMLPFLPLSLSHSAKKVFIASADLSGYADTFAMVSDENNDDWTMNLGDDTVFDDADFNQPNKFVDDEAYDENNDDWKMDFGDDKVFDDAYFNPPN
jgi:hypothetical protein